MQRGPNPCTSLVAAGGTRARRAAAAGIHEAPQALEHRSRALYGASLARIILRGRRLGIAPHDLPCTGRAVRPAARRAAHGEPPAGHGAQRVCAVSRGPGVGRGRRVRRRGGRVRPSLSPWSAHRVVCAGDARSRCARRRGSRVRGTASLEPSRHRASGRPYPVGTRGAAPGWLTYAFGLAGSGGRG